MFVFSLNLTLPRFTHIVACRSYTFTGIHIMHHCAHITYSINGFVICFLFLFFAIINTVAMDIIVFVSSICASVSLERVSHSETARLGGLRIIIWERMPNCFSQFTLLPAIFEYPLICIVSSTCSFRLLNFCQPRKCIVVSPCGFIWHFSNY